MKYYPENFGFIFREGTSRDDKGKLIRFWTPYRRACMKYGQGKVTKLVMDCIQEYICSSSSTSSTGAAANNRERSLLMAAITDKLVHRDALYLLLRNDPIAALSKIQQQVLCVVDDNDGQTGTDTDTNFNSNGNKSLKGATDTIAAAAVVSASLTTTAEPTTTTTVSSPPLATAAPTRHVLAQQQVLRVVGNDGQTGTNTNTSTNNTNSNDNNDSKGATDTIAAAAAAVSASLTTTAAPTTTTTVFDFVSVAISAYMTTFAAPTTTTTTVSSPPLATAAPTRDALAIIPFQASMNPTVATSANNASDTTICTIPSDSNDTLPD